jgi:hypothetical protein
VGFTKVIACIVFHFAFTPEVKQAITMLKFAAYHPEKFQSRFNAILIAWLKGNVVILTEYIMIFNLVYFTDDNGVKQVAFDFAALAVIATFDDSMLSIFHMTKVLNFQ